MIGRPIRFNFLKPNDIFPYFFNEDDIAKIFSVCHNLKHYAMLMTMFYEALRASELCGLNDEDLDFEPEFSEQFDIPPFSSAYLIIDCPVARRNAARVLGILPIYLPNG